VGCLYNRSSGTLPGVKKADAPTCRIVILRNKANPMTRYSTNRGLASGLQGVLNHCQINQIVESAQISLLLPGE
jgi:hypothetical protein